MSPIKPSKEELSAEQAELLALADQLRYETLIQLYNTYLEGKRSENFLDYNLGPAMSLNNLQSALTNFVPRFQPQDDVELLEAYTMRSFLIITRLFWLIGSKQIQTVQNINLNDDFYQAFGTDPFTNDQLVFFIEEYENKTRNSSYGEFFDNEFQITEKLYYKEYLQRGNTIGDSASFITLFLEQYKKDSQKNLRPIDQDALFHFYLMLLLLCRVHIFTGLAEPGSTEDYSSIEDDIS
jgi:hypothetical protein